MQPLEVSELKAFLIALSQLTALPDEVQAQLNRIQIPADIEKLYDIAKSAPQLQELYNNAHRYLDAISKERNKADLPIINHQAEQQSTENSNTLVTKFEKIDKLEKIERMDEDKLVEIATQSFESPNSVASLTAVLVVYP